MKTYSWIDEITGEIFTLTTALAEADEAFIKWKAGRFVKRLHDKQ